MIINNKNINIRRFSSGEMKLLYQDLIPLAINNSVEIIFKDDTENIFELFLICKFYIDNNIKVDLILAYLPYQRMDHINDFEAHTLKFVAQILNSLKLNSIKICEPHCELNLINKSQKISLVEPLFERFCKNNNFDISKDFMVFTDKGSLRRYSHLCKNQIYFEKSRDKFTGLICEYNLKSTIGTNNKFLIVDDIISSGDTIMNCLNHLPKNTQVDIICGHFEKNKYNNRILKSKRVNYVYTSDSLTKINKNKLKIFKIEELINKTL